ncbi:aspartyl protease und [Nicotiana attenuata]|uniref:Aspartyl protease und n=2 Tax=Nicotiana attenuata TaxID=49451 RepID=A0A314KPG7_NICAT|nr:aspartyl protease und [Nicotiana attenuata]
MCGVYGGKQGDKGKCLYKSKFPDQSVSMGTLGRDTLQFTTTSDNGKMRVPMIAFGCGTHNAGGGFGDEYSGILGLGPGETSLVRQIGSSQFSFCIGSLIINDPYSHLIIGDGATIEGNPTPFEIYQDSYYVKLDGISIGDKQLAIDRKVITNSVTFDLRTPTTYLPKGAYEVLSAEVTRLNQGKLELVDMVSDRLCFLGHVSEDVKYFPDVRIQFSEGACLALPPESLFDQTFGDAFCMTIESSEKDLTIIGFFAMQNYNVGFDLVEKQMYLEYVECEIA